MPDEIHSYNPETCKFVTEDGTSSATVRELCVWGIASLLAACLLFGGITYLVGSPGELWLKSRNNHLSQQLLTAQSQLSEYAVEINRLSERDQELYRILLQARQIPDHALQMNIGGALSLPLSGILESTRPGLAATTAQTVDTLERKIFLRQESYRHLSELLDQFEERLPQQPAILPANGPVISDYGMRYHPIYHRSRMHQGIDIRMETGSPVFATGAGTVVFAGRNGGYGLCIRLKHPATGHETRYAHLSSIPDSIQADTEVARGDLIGYSGSTGLSTGPHLHYEVRDADGNALNPVHFFSPEMTPRVYHADQEALSYDTEPESSRRDEYRR